MSDLAEKPAVSRPDEIDYPTSDGKPMAETDTHRKLMVYAIEALTLYFRDRPDVYVSGNNFIYWEEGNRKRFVSPDTYVVFGVGMRDRDCYKAWEEGGKLPDVVFEFTSKTTRREDTRTKRPLYEATLAVPEYFLFDPTGDYLKPRFQGYRLVGGHYVPLEVVEGRLRSERLGLDLVVRGEEFRFYDPARGEWLPTVRELAERAEREAERADAADAEIARLKAELER